MSDKEQLDLFFAIAAALMIAAFIIVVVVLGVDAMGTRICQ